MTDPPEIKPPRETADLCRQAFQMVFKSGSSIAYCPPGQDIWPENLLLIQKISPRIVQLKPTAFES
jgi:hypothetical protein